MADETRPPSKAEDSGETNPPRYVDLIGPNPNVRPWMLPYLPDNVFMRDAIVAITGLTLGVSLGVGLMLLLGDYGVIPGLVIGVIALWKFPGEVQGRHFGASVKFWQERNKIRRNRDS